MDVTATVSVVAGLVAAGSAAYTVFRTRALEAYRAELAAEGHEHEIRFARLHERRVDVIATLYDKLVKAEGAFGAFVHPVQEGGVEAQQERGQEAAAAGNDFSLFFRSNRIWLEQDLCDQIDALNRELIKVYYEFTAHPPEAGPELKVWHKSWKSLSEEIPPLRDEIEHRFRILLGVEKPD